MSTPTAITAETYTPEVLLYVVRELLEDSLSECPLDCDFIDSDGLRAYGCNDCARATDDGDGEERDAIDCWVRYHAELAVAAMRTAKEATQ
jgi:hypothetical protein